MSKPAPNFSAIVIGLSLSGGWIERSALDVTNVGKVEKILGSPDGAADPPVAPPSPKNVFFKARSVNA